MPLSLKLQLMSAECPPLLHKTLLKYNPLRNYSQRVCSKVIDSA